MSLNWGGYQNQGAPSGPTGPLPNAWNKIGGLLGKHLKGKMTDDKGLFQGGEKGRVFGRARDWLDDRFGWGDDGSGDGLEDEKFKSNRPTVPVEVDEDLEIEEFEDSPLTIEDPTQEDGVFTHGVDNPFSFKNSKYGQGRNWMSGYDPNNIKHWSPDGLSSYDDQTKGLYNYNKGEAGGPIEVSGGNNLSFNNDFSLLNGNNNNFTSQQFTDFIGNSDFLNSSFLGNGFLGNSPLGDFINTNPSEVDNNLIESNISGGQGWNQSNRGSNWRGTY